MYSKERDEAFIEAVVNDNWDKVREYSRKYKIPIPRKKDVMKAGVYKAVQECTNIPESVKSLGIAKPPSLS